VNGHPLFSIVTVCLDAEAHIADAVESVLAQSFADYEYVVADGGSTDGTLDVLRSYEPRFGGRMKWLSEPDDGLYDAMNRALARASGEYVEFLGADDRLRPGALDAVARALETAPRPDIVCGATHVLGPTGSRDEAPRRVVRRGLPARVPASHQSTFIGREAIQDAGGFDLRFRIAADYDLYLRLVEAGRTEMLIDDVLSDFRLGGVSSRSARATAREYRDVRVAHGANPAVEKLVMLKSAAAATLFAAWMRLFGRAPSRTPRTRATR
jgi:glycosyltransferase involved in cell wall biosynthesis